jgi:uncharacterized membrane protein YphA (DoxX/SURF4 family)
MFIDTEQRVSRQKPTTLVRKTVVETSRIIFGTVFIFSGFAKSIDPWGSVYKIEEYLTAFHMGFFDFLAIPCAFFLFAIEFGVGVCLLLGIYRKVNSLFALIFMAVMTPLTLYSAIMNPVTDCGCFGDALPITPWASFFKNIPLLLMSVVLYLQHSMITPLFTGRFRFFTLIWTYTFILGFGLYGFCNLPVFDFRPYRVGTNLPAAMTVPENAEQPVFDTRFIYSYNGKQREFTIDNYPKDDSTWIFVKAKTLTVKKDYQPPVHDFSITAGNGDDITGSILSDTGFTFLLIAPKLEKASTCHTEQINNMYDYAEEFGCKFYALTASLSSEIRKWTENTGAEYPFCTTDEVTLKTIIRSNPGLLLLKNGTIINKWPGRAMPDIADSNMPPKSIGAKKNSTNRNIQNILVITFVFLMPPVILFLFPKLLYKKE